MIGVTDICCVVSTTTTTSLRCRLRSGQVSYPHPYQPELDTYEPPDGQLTRVQPQRPTAVNSSDHADDNATWVDTVEGLRDLQRTLDAEMEIAIDLEAHNYRTYASFACLMQLSTRTRDYLVDVIALRSEVSACMHACVCVYRCMRCLWS